MKKLALIFCMAFLLPQAGAQAHQERHVHSQWITQKLSQMNRTVQQLKARIDQLENRGSGSSGVAGGARGANQGNKVYFNEACSSGEQKLCQKGCPTGWKIEKSICVGKGSIGRTTHEGRRVSCYCFSPDDPNCQVQAVTATCVRP